MTFNEKLIFLRKQKNWSQEQLGEQINVSRQTISKWELGDTTPEMEKLILLSDIFDLSIDKLVGHEPYENTPASTDVKDSSNSNTTVIHSFAWHYEYKSKKMLWGVPLVHINVGHGIYKAKGIIAIGTIAKGILSLGAVSLGIIALGASSIGVISLGAATLGLLLAVGAISVGTISIGGLAVGVLAFGGVAVGMYSIGGAAIASKIAAGGYAQAPIAIGDKTNDSITFDINKTLIEADIKNAILLKYPKTWKIILDLFKFIS